MSNDNQVLIIDAGNTFTKIAFFCDDKLLNVKRIPSDKIHEHIFSLKKSNIAISSVLSKQETKKIIQNLNSTLLITHETPIPLTLKYKSPSTLGMDRICNAVYAKNHIKTGYAVTIDIGTCIKFDLVSAEGDYLGGSISPGIDLRYKSLNNYTDNLPLLSEKSETQLIGTDTNTSIHSGVMNGIKAEIHRLIEEYALLFDDLTFFMTGGDARYFDIHSKNDIFAVENLTLIGLYEIYKFNA